MAPGTQCVLSQCQTLVFILITAKSGTLSYSKYYFADTFGKPYNKKVAVYLLMASEFSVVKNHLGWL